MTADLAIFLAILLVVAGAGLWLYKAGGKSLQAKILKQEQKDQEAFNESGEEWDSMGGLGGIVTRRVRGKGWNLRKKLGLGK